MNKKTLSILSLALMAGALTGCSKGLDVKESMTIEYGEAISTDVATYLSDEVTGEERTKVLAEAKVVLENDKKAEGQDYQLPGDYTVNIKYNGDITEVKVTVKDTKKPVFKDLKKELEYVRDCKPTAEELAKQFNAEDLDEVTITVDDSQVDYAKEGTYKAIVKAVDNSKNEEVQEITIKVVSPTLKLDKTSKSMYEKESFVLKATVKGKDTKAKFSSSNNSVATVSETGKVTAKKKGTVTITVEANGIKAECTVTVKSVPKGSSTTTQTVTNPTTGKKEEVTVVKPKPSNPGGTTSASATTARELLGLINAERQKAGVSSLSWASGLDSLAKTRAKECTVKYSHVRPDGSLVNYGEILTGGTSASKAMSNWMNSSSHKASILNADYKSMSAAKIKDPEYPGYIWVVLFNL